MVTNTTFPSSLRTAATASAIRPFKSHTSDEALANLRRRIAATSWSDGELVPDASLGVQLATMRELARHWETAHDWRKIEARLNALPQFMTNVYGVDIHFHPRPLEGDERIAAHRHTWVARLDHRAVEDHRSADQSDSRWRELQGCL
jgi:hypothetical protein